MSLTDAKEFPGSWLISRIDILLPLTYGTGLVKKNRLESGSIPVYGSSGIIGYHNEYLVEHQSLIVGRKGSIGTIYISSGPSWPIDTTYFIEGTRSTNLIFFGYLLTSMDLGALNKATAIPGLSRDDYSKLEIPVPPLAEQRRIVAEIEKQFTRLDASVAVLKRAQANLKLYRSSVLKAAYEGKLVPTEAELAQAEGDDYEPAGQLLQRMLAERRSRWSSERVRLGKYKEPVPPDTSDLPDLPEGWAWSTLSQVTDLKGGVTKGQRHQKRQPLKEIPYLRVANVQRGYLDLEHLKNIQVTQETIDKLRLVPGDILFTEGGDRDKLGRGWVWNGEVDECIHQNHVFRSRLLLDSMRPELISWWGNTFGKNFFSEGGKQTTNLASINLTLLAQFPIPIPPIQEQHRIVAEVERRLSVVQQAESTVEAGLKRAERLRQSILKQAFSGKLVPQDPNDEPAALLLERIRAERAGAEVAARVQRKTRRRRSRPKPARQLSLSEETP